MVKSLEGLRGVAALLVALYHLKIGASLFPAIRHGWIFVDLFFVLSGFVIARAYADRLNTWREASAFLLRRFGRLYPLLILSTVLWVLVANGVTSAKLVLIAHGMAGALNSPGEASWVVPTAGELVATATMTHALGMFDSTILNFVTWSISTEFWTYVLFAVLLLTVSPARRSWFFAGLAATMFCVAAWASIGQHQCLERGQCLALTYDFAYPRCVASFLLGALVFRYRHLRRHAEVAAQIACVVALVVLLSWLDRFPGLAFVFPIVCAVLIWSLARDRGRSPRPWPAA